MKFAMLLVLAVVGCSVTKNPAKCLDGVCVDTTRPYCDFDGLIGGEPEACIAVDCVADALEACRGDTAVKCNNAGTDYVEVECPRGCAPESNGCRECETNVQCTSSNPICDVETSVCRSCTNDAECDSAVCMSGGCVPETEIVYASPTGFGTCSRNQPCILSTGVTNARSNAKILRMLPGTYTTPLIVGGVSPLPLNIVATGASISTLGDEVAVQIKDGADVRIGNLSSVSERHLNCTSSVFASSQVTLVNGTFTGLGNNTAMEVGRCRATLTNMQVTSASGSSSYVLSDGSLELDRVRMATNASQGIVVVNAARARIQITNSLLINTDVSHFSSIDTQAPGTSFTIAYSTLVNRGARWSDLCNGTGMYRTIRFENSIIASLGNSAEAFPVTTSECSFTNTVVFPHVGTSPGLIKQDPLFVGSSMEDFHLRAESPAIDRGGGGTIPPSSDLEGRSRGTSPDLGAYELP